ncbi:MAG TPA: TonB-dependent receptor [Fermentimonas caenicola]|nr:TonB-dependent receptor [Fermentimonas caenicola]
MRLSLSFILLLFSVSAVLSQVADISKRIAISGTVHDADNGGRMAASTVSLQPANRHVETDKDGFFSFGDLEPGDYKLSVQFIGYEELTLPVSAEEDTVIHLYLKPIHLTLSEIMVSGKKRRNREQISALAVREIGRDYLLRNNSTNFVQTLASISGISSMVIGAGFSKPVIRGLGFNRIAVVDKGVVQQNQQWGADHGLEIDQYDVDNVRVHKGPMSLFYGSDAIGGVIEIMPPQIPDHDQFWGDITLIGKSNNDLLGTSVSASRKKGNMFYRGRATIQSYADYRIPTDTIDYLTWKMPVYGRRMKNSAGREYNLSFSSNYSDDNFSSWLHLSNVNAKNGFFPGAHGIPALNRLEHDGSYRNIEMPYSTSNHLKVISNNEWNINNKGRINLDLGYQNNHREEMSQFHTHYSNQLPPAVDPDLEIQFILNTYTAGLRYLKDEGERWSKIIGVSAEYQHNRVGGYSFLLPEFDRLSGGVFWLNSIRWSDNLTLTGGLRYDIGKLDIYRFYDSVLSEYLLMQGYDEQEADLYSQRSSDISRTFNDLSYSAGISYDFNKRHSLKLNVGSSFRYPGANELSSNGVHHGAFRHEMGNDELKSEKGLQLDADYHFRGKKLSVTLNPFITWFNNYIYLNPTGEWSVLPHAGQIYRYSQSAAFMAGGEMIIRYDFTNNWSATSDFEYLFSVNMEDNYPLPFTPPAAVTTDLTYSDLGTGLITQYSFSLENRMVMDQNRVSRNEEITPGTSLWNLSANAHWDIGGRRIVTQFRADNIFNRAYLNHLSFYRKLNAPEPGRNIQLIIKMMF